METEERKELAEAAAGKRTMTLQEIAEATASPTFCDKKSGKETMTLQEIAEATGATLRTVSNYAQAAGWTKNGVRTELDEKQVALIVAAMKAPTSAGAKSNLEIEMLGVEASMSLEVRAEVLHKQLDELRHAAILRDLEAANSKVLALTETIRVQGIQIELVQKDKDALLGIVDREREARAVAAQELRRAEEFSKGESEFLRGAMGVNEGLEVLVRHLHTAFVQSTGHRYIDADEDMDMLLMDTVKPYA
jgi:hypothetical protein